MEESERLSSLNSFGAERIWDRGCGSVGREGLGTGELGRGDSCSRDLLGWEFTCTARKTLGGRTEVGMN